MLRGSAAIMAISILTSGCLALPRTLDEARLSASRPTVIAILEEGLNVYHDQFRGPNLSAAYLAQIGAVPISPTWKSSLAESLAADRKLWNATKIGQLYYLRGTRILAVSFLPDGYLADLDMHSLTRIAEPDLHGTAVGSAALNASDSTIVLVVQVPLLYNALEPDGSARPFYRQALFDAMDWLAKQPYVDIVSFSLAVAQGATGPEGREFGRAFAALHAAGKLIVSGGGNTPNPGWFGTAQGPPDGIIVGGANPGNRSIAGSSAQYSDVVGDYEARVARYDDLHGKKVEGGTSIAAPLVAGTLGDAIARWRATHPGGSTMPSLEAWRSALNATATVWNVTDYSPSTDHLADLRMPSTPAWWTQEGWGYVSTSDGARLAAALESSGGKIVPVPPSKATGAPFMQAQYEARAAFWSAWSE